MLKKKIHEYKECGPKDYTPEAAEAIMNILRGLHTNQKWEYLTSPNKRECLGRELCLRSLKSHQNDEGNLMLFASEVFEFHNLHLMRVWLNSFAI